MKYFARSPKEDTPAQPYEEHIRNVVDRAAKNVEGIAPYAPNAEDALRASVLEAARFHDLGKLCEENQACLREMRSRGALPINHVDAGTAYCLSQGGISATSGVLVQAHHVGLASFPAERVNGEKAFRDAGIMQDMNRRLGQLLAAHEASLGDSLEDASYAGISLGVKNRQGSFFRIALSCLADADHSDAARSEGKEAYRKERACIPLKPQERLAALERYVGELKRDDSERTKLRQEMFDACVSAGRPSSIASCDSPVGSGKTTAVMAYLLALAAKRGMRRIIVVLPYTNIIAQSVSIYRKALTLPGEDATDVIAEIHHRADFESLDERRLTALWSAPIIVTTAVAFFETLASNTPATLRRLHRLPGSAIFVDESHAALPAHLLPLAWKWMNEYANDWGCCWLLASGSMNRFWEIEEIAGDIKTEVPEIVGEPLRVRLAQYEKQRITYRQCLQPKRIEELAEWISTFPGPRLVILNTVQNAAVLADHLHSRYGEDKVLHLSSALTPADREATLNLVKERLKSPSDDDWTLVATSCVEAGVDLSFRTGFREAASVVSLLQAAGRINREGLFEDAEIWTFLLAEDELLNANPGLKHSAEVLLYYLRKGHEISPQLSTDSIRDEIVMFGMAGDQALADYDKKMDFPEVEKGFRVIDNNACIAVVDSEVKEGIGKGKIDWQELQRKSVQISRFVLERERAPQIADGIYEWTLGYDSFLGYMKGIIEPKKLWKGSGII